MADARQSIIAPEGRTLVAISILLMLFLHGMLGVIVTPLWLVIISLMWVLRETRRTVPSAPLGIISPVDGQIIQVEKCRDPYRDQPMIRISIRMSASGTFSLRSPIEGKIMQHWYNHPQQQMLPYAHSIWVQTDEADDLLIGLYPGRWFGRIACYISTGERVGQGQRCGYIPLGTRVDVYLPHNSQPEVQGSDQISAGETILGRLIHE